MPMQAQIFSSPELSKQIFDFKGGSLRLIEIPQPVRSCEAVALPDYLLYHILEGHKLFFSGNQRWELVAGDSLLIRRQSAVSCEARLRADSPFRALSIHLSQELLDHFAQAHQLAEVTGAQTQNAAILQVTPGFKNCLQGLQTCFDPQALVWETLLAHKITELLLHLLHPSQQGALAVCAEVLSGRRRAYLEMLAGAISRPLPTEEMAKTMGMSLSAFKREFKLNFAQTPARYLMQRRLEQAQQLLLTTADPVQNIALGAGFENPSHFVQAFKRLYGQTPGEYRQDWPQVA